jgi:cytochrome c biogenesis protein CcmG/thiol:disulfide interchange protein DsbE
MVLLSGPGIKPIRYAFPVLSDPRPSRLRTNLGPCAAAACLLALCVMAPSAAARQARPPAPPFTLTDSKGAAVSLEALKGRVVQVDFWATWCASCKVEIPWFMEFQAKYGARGLSTVGVAMDLEGWKIVRPYLAKHPFNYPIVLGDDTLARQYDVPGLPVTVLIDRAGRIAESHVGLVDKAAWERRIQALLQEPPK